MALQLEEDKGAILRLVQLKMDRIAPNLSAAVGTEIAAQLMGVAGGLLNLSKMPACNVQVGRGSAVVVRWAVEVGRRGGQPTWGGLPVPTTLLSWPHHPPPLPQVLGAKRKNLAGFSSTTAQPHQGFIFASDIIQQTPPSLRSKAARLVGAKCTLLARIDAYGQVGGRGVPRYGRGGDDACVGVAGGVCAGHACQAAGAILEAPADGQRGPILACQPTLPSAARAGPQRGGGRRHEGGHAEED